MNFSKHGEWSVRRALYRASLTFMVAALAATTIANTEELSPQALEYRVKAGFLYTFAKYIEWPSEAFATPTNSIVIGILGENPFSKMLDATVDGKTIDGRSIRIQQFRQVDDVQACHVLFISVSEKDRLANIQARLRGRNILTVSDGDGFLQNGGQIQFVTEDNRVKFDINLEATRQAGLKLDANLLRVARRVVHRESRVGPD